MKNEKDFNIIIADIESEFVSWAAVEFKDHDKVAALNENFVNLKEEWDCMVSPANSYGLMDGGIDLAISSYFGWDLMERVQDRIKSDYYGEQPVGTSMIVETGDKDHPYLAHTPTMRLPQEQRGTDVPYVAMLAMLQAVAKHNEMFMDIGTVVVSGLATGCGRVPFSSAARQMALAYETFVMEPENLSWQHAKQQYHKVEQAVWGE